MAFFKTARDQIKAQGFLTYLEQARDLFNPTDLFLTARYLNLALKEMAKVKKAKAEYFFSRQGWLYVIELCKELGKALRQTQRNDLVQACFSIYDWALECEDALDGSGMLSVMRAKWLNNLAAGVPAYDRIAALADSDDQFELGMTFLTGDRVPVDERKAFHWLSQASAKGHPAAQFQLGMMYAKGEGVAKDESKAAEFFAKGAAQGLRNAQYSLGVIYMNGLGVSKDSRKAVELFKKAAAQGDTSAEYNLAVMLANGEGVSKDDRKAVELFESAAAKGCPQAQLNLGLCYARRGCSQKREKGL